MSCICSLNRKVWRHFKCYDGVKQKLSHFKKLLYWSVTFSMENNDYHQPGSGFFVHKGLMPVD